MVLARFYKLFLWGQKRTKTQEEERSSGGSFGDKTRVGLVI